MTTQPVQTFTPDPYRYGTPEAPAPVAGRAGGSTTTAEATTGLAFIRNVFAQVFGGALTEFAEQAWRDYNSGKPLDQILDELRQTKEYAARFPGMAALHDAGRPISETAYLDLERTYTQIGRNFDLPPGILDTAYLGAIIAGEKSPAEFQRQLQDWQTYERATRDPVAEAEINRQFAAMGLVPSEGDYLAVLLRPDIAPAHIEQRLLAGQIGTEAVRAGYGQIGVDQGLALADQGVTVDQARQGFNVLGDSTELFSGLPGETGADTLGRGEQIGAVFGTDAASRRRIEAQRRRRQADFSGGGGTAQGRSGLVGLAPSG